MFFSDLLIVGGGLMMASMEVEARAIGKLSFLPHLPFTLPSSLSSPSPSTPPPTIPSPSQDTCAFTPHVPIRTTQSAFSIPESAWPILRTLLTTHIIPSPPSTSPATQREEDASLQAAVQPLILHNSVLTIHLSDSSSDASLEGLVLGLVFSTGEQEAAHKELRSLPPSKRGVVSEGSEVERRNCIEEAIRKVEAERVMEGVHGLDERGGTVGFLVYRVD